MRPRPRIAHCGTLMIGVKASMPKAPRLLIVNVPRSVPAASTARRVRGAFKS